MVEVTYTGWGKLFYKGEDHFFDALEEVVQEGGFV